MMRLYLSVHCVLLVLLLVLLVLLLVLLVLVLLRFIDAARIYQIEN